ncbi:MAG: formate dehydrogenase accessory sulfurtransferase FdhD [Pseudomonadota bacterium]
MRGALPFLTEARAPLTHAIEAMDEAGQIQQLDIPAERPLTVYVDKRELVTLMTLGSRPEWLTLGYLLNQRLIETAGDVESITVDWDVGAAAVKTRDGIADIAQKTERRVVTTGCGQGSLFGEVMAHIEGVVLPPTAITQSQLYAVVNTMRLNDSTYKSAGSVHGCALFRGEEPLLFVEDVGRHNAIDSIAGWMALQSSGDASFAKDGLFFYTTGRLTSEMVMKAAQMGIAVVISRSGITQMGHAVAQELGLCAIGRALNKRFLCFSTPQRLKLDVPAASGMAQVGV